MPTPKAIREAPEFLPGLDYYYESFLRLSASRSIGQGVVGPIPYIAISEYCKDEGLEDEDRAEMFYHIEHLDAVYIEHVSENIKRELNSSRPQPSPPKQNQTRRR